MIKITALPPDWARVPTIEGISAPQVPNRITSIYFVNVSQAA
ncbi:MAG: hypothetical protein ACLVE7_07305 [Coprococcus comes]|nr:hypothetical protein [Coprococcus comes]MDC0798786.1 hypothetical protein [Coprococcus comes]